MVEVKEVQVLKSMEITDRDVATLRWLAQWWGATAVQVDRWWRLDGQVGLHGPSGAPRLEVARRRLAAMQRVGIVVGHWMPTSPARIHAVTGDGLRAAGLGTWTVPRWRWSQFRHEYAVIEIALDLLAAGWEVVPERRMRQDDALGAGSWSLVLATDGRAASHYPDLWVRPDDSAPWRAVEVELARKSLPRLVGILSGYRERGAGVTYYTAERAVADAVRRAAERARLHDLDVRRAVAAGGRQPASSRAPRG